AEQRRTSAKRRRKSADTRIAVRGDRRHGFTPCRACPLKKRDSLCRENDDKRHLMPNAVWLRFYKMPFAKVYPAYIAKAERKGRTKQEVDEIIRWLTGYTQGQLEAEIEQATDVETFYTHAPAPNPARSLITGTIC